MTQPKKRWIKRFTFDDSDDFLLPLADEQLLLAQQYAAMMASDDPDLRRKGDRLLHELAKRSAAQIGADLQRATASRKDRPGASSPLSKKIRKTMRQYKRGGQAFKVFLKNWEELGEIEGLCLTISPDGEYLIEDQNGSKDDVGSYKYSALKTYWSKKEP